ncbi:MAG: hypothetical protein OEP48_07275 [Betaproteobacteria bacterium]|nr:hypothetical protein [Betaproteobacteria bacterium]MDH3438265.1 hypothetical protein [Betaproteobacteria bacterium]
MRYASEGVPLIVRRANGRTDNNPVTLRLDTPVEVDYVRHGGIMPYVVSEITKVTRGEQTAKEGSAPTDS